MVNLRLIKCELSALFSNLSLCIFKKKNVCSQWKILNLDMWLNFSLEQLFISKQWLNFLLEKLESYKNF